MDTFGTEGSSDDVGGLPDVVSFGCGPGPLAVIDMHRGDAAAGGDAQNHERQRVGTARDATGQLGTRIGKGG
jgi:hypothetical protein